MDVPECACLKEQRSPACWTTSSSACPRQPVDSWIAPDAALEKLLQRAGIHSTLCVCVCVLSCLGPDVSLSWGWQLSDWCSKHHSLGGVGGGRGGTHTHTHTRRNTPTLVFRDHVLQGCSCPNTVLTLSVQQSDHTDH